MTSFSTEPKRRRVLILSYYFPPMADVAMLRAFYFARHLPKFGYEPIVVTANPETRINADVLADLPPECRVLRVPAWNRTGIDVSTGALRTAMGAFRSIGFDLVFGTGPTWGTLKTALLVSLATRRPLVADIRDPWTYGYLWQPTGPGHAWIQRSWERAVLRRARRVLYVDPAVMEHARRRCRPEHAAKMRTITHGFDDTPTSSERSAPADTLTFAHFGKLHPRFRDPEPLLRAFRIASENEGFARDARLAFYGTRAPFVQIPSDLRGRVELCGTLSLSRAARRMRGTDVLVLLQLVPTETNSLIPLKTYEYLATGRPILGVMPDEGIAANLVRETGTSRLVGFDDPSRIAEGLLAYWQTWQAGGLPTHRVDVSRFAQTRLTNQLAGVFDEALSGDSDEKGA